ncbi:MAG: hypothetical protein COA78_28600 [Blastopirellula sp.]|nr:MAG: hypothetical protein COA78_28600 [Blastopirellula sp.]
MSFRLLMVVTLLVAVVGCQKSTANVQHPDRSFSPELKNIRRLSSDRYSTNLTVHKNAEQWFSANELPTIVTLTDLMQQGNPYSRGEAANQLALMISPGLRSLHFQKHYYGQPLHHGLDLPEGRPVKHQQAELARTSAIKSLDYAYLRIAISDREINPSYSDWVRLTSSVCECLAEVGDMSTADHLVELLKQQNAPRPITPLISSIEKIHGLPPSCQPIFLCGNSTPAEREATSKRALLESSTAARQLIAWHERNRLLSPEERMEVVVEDWVTHLEQPLGQDVYYSFEHIWVWPNYASLIRLGKDAVPHLKKHQAETNDDQLKAKIALAIAAITGEEDKQMIAQLLAGGVRDQSMACEIIVVTGNENWNKELDAMQTTLSSPTLKASNTLTIVLGKQALPYLKHAKFGGASVENAIRELEKWDDQDDQTKQPN